MILKIGDRLEFRARVIIVHRGQGIRLQFESGAVLSLGDSYVGALGAVWIAPEPPAAPAREPEVAPEAPRLARNDHVLISAIVAYTDVNSKRPNFIAKTVRLRLATQQVLVVWPADVPKLRLRRARLQGPADTGESAPDGIAADEAGGLAPG